MAQLASAIILQIASSPRRSHVDLSIFATRVHFQLSNRPQVRRDKKVKNQNSVFVRPLKQSEDLGSIQIVRPRSSRGAMAPILYLAAILLVLFALCEFSSADLYCYWTTCHRVSRPNSYRPGFEFRKLMFCDTPRYVREYYCKEIH